jgi:Rrf2 family nitric oxide-sensitive transcriptional repressor
MRISKTTHNALQILIATARSGTNLIKGAAVAEELDLTEQNTSKIVHLLSRGGFIKAVRGPQGGMTLAQKPEDIRIGDVVMAMERMSIEDERGSANGDVSKLFDHALDAFVSVLNQHTLADMARGKRSTFLGLEAKKSKAKSKSATRKSAAASDYVRSERASKLKPRDIPK